MNIPLVAPVFPAGKEPLPPGITEEEREAYLQAKKYERLMTMGMESCVAKTVIAGAGGTSLCTYVVKTRQDITLQVPVAFASG